MEKHITGMKRINPYKQFIGSFIPEWLEERSEISPGAKLCYARLARFAGKDGSCYPKRETIAKGIGISERQVDRYIKELKKQGLINVRQSGLGKNNEYIFYHHEWMDGYYKDKTDVSDQEVTDMAGQESTDVSSLRSSNVASPYIRESYKENQSKRVSSRQKIPTAQEVRDYFKSKGYKVSVADKFYEYYNQSIVDGNRVWKDGKGNTIKNWKQKAISVWMKDEHKIKTQSGEIWNNTHKI